MVVAMLLLVLVILNAAITGWLLSQHSRIREKITEHDERIKEIGSLLDV